MKTIINFIFFSTAVGIGAILVHLGLTLSNWETWAIIGCVFINNCCLTIKGIMKGFDE